MIPRIRPLTIALVVALLAAAVPARASVRPATDHRFDHSAALTPIPLDGHAFRLDRGEPARSPARRSAQSADRRAVPPPDAEAEASAAVTGRWGMASLLAFSGIGALIIVLVTLMVMGQDPRGGRTA